MYYDEPMQPLVSDDLSMRELREMTEQARTIPLRTVFFRQRQD